MPEYALSVVVIGRNEGDRLERCLESVARMTFADSFEVIYVDSASSDGSASRAATLGAKVVELKGERLSAGRARNAGWRISSAPLLLFLDGDTIVDPDFVVRAVPEFQDPRVMVVSGHRREIHPEASIYSRVLDLNWSCLPGPAEFCGGDALMRRTALEEVEGFDAELIAGEEPDLCRRIRARGGLVLNIDAPMTGHDFAMVSWRQYWRHSFRAGHAYAEVSARYRETSDPLWSDASRNNSVHIVAYALTPLLAILAARLTHSWRLVALCGVICFAVVIARTTFKARRTSSSRGLLVLFAIHSHIQHIPVFLGRLRYWRNSRRQSRSGLIEYKDTP
jgi:cellulose synthase/poly-beta-1,6-N-acetylglucosamine synthase-like glycosyltransferase